MAGYICHFHSHLRWSAEEAREVCVSRLNNMPTRKQHLAVLRTSRARTPCQAIDHHLLSELIVDALRHQSGV